MEKRGFVYIMASRRNGTIYIGVTSDLAKRAYAHRNGLVEGFTRKYGCKLLRLTGLLKPRGRGSGS